MCVAVRDARFSPLDTAKQTFACFQVAELIAGLEGLGCTRTTGEDQTVCVMSDSFDTTGRPASLQAAGILPPVDIVKVSGK